MVSVVVLEHEWNYQHSMHHWGYELMFSHNEGVSKSQPTSDRKGVGNTSLILKWPTMRWDQHIKAANPATSGNVCCDKINMITFLPIIT